MRYRNTKTGAILDSLCVISGGDWIKEEPEVEEVVLIDEPEEEPEDETEEPEEIIEEIVETKPGKKGK